MPQAGMGTHLRRCLRNDGNMHLDRAFGPRRTSTPFLGRCPRLEWGRTFGAACGTMATCIWIGPLALGALARRSWGDAPGWNGDAPSALPAERWQHAFSAEGAANTS